MAMKLGRNFGRYVSASGKGTTFSSMRETAKPTTAAKSYCSGSAGDTERTLAERRKLAEKIGAIGGFLLAISVPILTCSVVYWHDGKRMFPVLHPIVDEVKNDCKRLFQHISPWKDSKAISQAKPEIEKWRYTPISHYDKMELLFAKDRANGKGAISAKERLRQWAREENPINLDEPFINVDSTFSPFETISVPENNQIDVDTPKVGGKRKAAMVDLIEKQVEVINGGLNGVAEAIKEANIIAEKIAEKQFTLAEKARPKVYTEEEVYAELQNIGVPRGLMVDALLYLIKNQVDLRAFFAVSSDMRLELLYKLLNI